MKVVMAFSGGMDSTTLMAKALDAGHEVVPVHFQYGSKHNFHEEQAVRKLRTVFTGLAYGYEFNLRQLFANYNSALLKGSGQNEIPEGHYEAESMRKTVVPGRNSIFITILTGLAESMGAAQVWLGIHAGDHFIYPDCRPDFFYAMKEAMGLASDGKVDLDAPFLHMNKRTILALGRTLNVPYELTRTCYKDQPIACGKCGSCQERLEAFKLNGMEDPIEYESRELLPKGN